MVWPIVAYLLWHSLHQRVYVHWLSPVYPAFVIAAAVAADQLEWKGLLARLIDMCRSWAVPTGLAMSVVAGLQASTGLIPLRTFDRELGAGWHGLAAEIETARARLGVTTLITTSYTVTAWLSFYMPPGTRVVQINDRIRWVNMPQPDRSQLERALYVGGPGSDLPRVEIARMHYRVLEPITEIARMRRGVVIATFQLYLADGLLRPLPGSAGISVGWVERSETQQAFDGVEGKHNEGSWVTPYYHILTHTPAHGVHGDLLSIAPQGYTQVASGASGGLNLPGGPFSIPQFLVDICRCRAGLERHEHSGSACRFH